jgi:hypothetical protein
MVIEEEVRRAHLVPKSQERFFRLLRFQPIKEFLQTILPWLEVQYAYNLITELITLVSPSIHQHLARLNDREVAAHGSSCDGGRQSYNVRRPLHSPVDRHSPHPRVDSSRSEEL